MSVYKSEPMGIGVIESKLKVLVFNNMNQKVCMFVNINPQVW